jgi:hypothetical protein
MNLVTVILILMTGEIVFRVSTTTLGGLEKLGRRTLLPKDWGKFASHYRTLLAPDHPTFLIYDDIMGVTNGPNRRSADGLGFTSQEGIRAPHAEFSFAERTGRTRIAIVGDSFTFGAEVSYEYTWGHFLEKVLGSNFQVLNFGVNGYGVDQMYLRYEKDVRSWKPNIVILGFIADDLGRTMNVYPFLSAPTWGNPFSKPRFILRDGNLVRVNVPPLTPEAIFSRASISELPFLELDIGYKQSHWEKRWYHLSYLIRLFITWFHPWSKTVHDAYDTYNEALVSVNASILKAFVRSTAQTGAIPMVVYFPRQEARVGGSGSMSPIARRVLQEADIAYIDLTPCLLKLDPADRFKPLLHYTPQGNAAIANCLKNVVEGVMSSAPARWFKVTVPSGVEEHPFVDHL